MEISRRQFSLSEAFFFVVVAATLAAVSRISGFWSNAFFTVLFLTLLVSPAIGLVAFAAAVFNRELRWYYLRNAAICAGCCTASALALGFVLGW